jgi:ATP-dependent Lhr-like helicase
VVLDELHMVDGSYRGDQLRILLKRLNLELGINWSTYASSATVSV